nr:T9SS type A sorting domain-containing protein [Rhodothermaceae bacterium]
LTVDTPVVLTDRSIRSLELFTHEPDLRSQLPTQFTLQGNYPNPFNPTTNIVFDLPEAAEVQLEVYDLLGRLVMTSPIAPFEAGPSHQITVDGSSLASGTYIYHLSAQTASGEWVRIGKMTVLK